MSLEDISFNGINIDTGSYLITPSSFRQLANRLGLSPERDVLEQAFDSYREREEKELRPKAGIEETDLSQTGWCVVFPENGYSAIREALRPLLQRRAEQAGDLFQEVTFRENTTELQFQADQGRGPGPVDPKTLPYYVLLVGSPSAIPFSIQYQLAVEFAVGRLDLGSNPEAYALYADNVVQTEKKKAQNRRALFFGVSNPDDNATKACRHHLIEPLAEEFAQRAQTAGWTTNILLEKNASKDGLSTALEHPDGAPGLIFTGSHGLGLIPQDPRQISLQGAILCSDWPGPRSWKKAIPEAFYYCAADVSSKAKLDGSIFFSFACFSAGTPKTDSFYFREGSSETPLASTDFVASLPQKLLTQGAGAFIGHIDRAWTFSFYWPEAKAQRAVFESSLTALLQGLPVGAAMDYFGIRHAKLATSILQFEADRHRSRGSRDPVSRIGLWTAYHDARSYVILGDPAVRLAEPRS